MSLGRVASLDRNACAPVGKLLCNAWLPYPSAGARLQDLARPSPPERSAEERTPPGPAAAAPPPKHFFAAAGELVLLEALPWVYNRYAADEDFARISAHTIRENFRTGFKYDRDDFNTNQSAHPYHGSLFFEAGRSNGYDFWASGAFALAGSLLWECCMENTPPSINDLVNTTLGGITRGEISHRLSVMLLDNTASGSSRLWRELGGAVLNPVGAFNRLLRGEMTEDFPNPQERFPDGFGVSADLGYRHIGGAAAHPSQAIVSLSARYGDPFAGDIHKPFDSFWAGADLNFPGGTTVSRIEERGVLKGWELGDPSAPVRHIFGFSQEYEYLNNESQIFGAEMLSVGLLSRFNISEGVIFLNDASAIAIPLAGIQTTNVDNPQTGRNYDYAPGGGFRVAARISGAGQEIVAVGYGVAWARTVNGTSHNNTLQFFRASGRIPIVGPLSIGGGYWWYSRKTTYVGFSEPRSTQSEWRTFVSISFGASGLWKPKV
jgi:hypothetical protein